MGFLQQLLLKQIPACFELKCRAYSLLSRCYLLVGTISSVKQTLRKGIELSTSAGTGYCVKSPGTKLRKQDKETKELGLGGYTTTSSFPAVCAKTLAIVLIATCHQCCSHDPGLICHLLLLLLFLQ